MTDLSLLGDRILEARERASLTREDLATRLGVSTGAVTKWELGTRTLDLETLCRLSDVLAVTTGWLLGRRQRGRPFTPKGGTNTPASRPTVIPPGWPCLSQPGGCICKCHAVRAGRLRSTKTPKKQANIWAAHHDALLRERLAAAVTPDEIAEELTDRFGVKRSPLAVKTRAVRLGISLYDGWTSSTQLSEKLGVPQSRVETWRERGYLKGTPGFKRWPRYLDHEIEAFVREHAGVLFDVRLVRDQQLKPLAETSAIVNKRRQAV